MGKEKARFSLYMIVGAYLIYLAYQMYQNPEVDQRSMVINVFMVLFFVIGIGLLIFGCWLLYQNVKHPQKDSGAEETKSDSETEGIKGEDHANEIKSEDSAADEKEDEIDKPYSS